MATLTEVRSWADAVQSEIIGVSATIDIERATPLPTADLERRLQEGRIGHMRYRLVSLQALQRFLAAGIAALSAGQSHPVQMLTAPATSSGMLSIPKRPPPGSDL